MEFNIRADKRVLYKNGNSSWLVGTVCHAENAEVNEKGVWIPIAPINTEGEIHWAEIHNIFTEGAELDDWMKDNLVRKEDYVKIIQQEDFEKNLESAWFSDGEYYYYPVSKFSESWIMRQPLDYVIRSN